MPKRPPLYPWKELGVIFCKSKKASQSLPPAGGKKLKSFFTATCAWGKIPLRLQVWNFAACGKIMRAADCKPFGRKIEDFSPAQFSSYPWLRIKFTLSRQFSFTFTQVSIYTFVPMNFSMSRRARELMRLIISPPLPMMMPWWLAFSQ